MAGSAAEERIRAKVEATMRRRFPDARIVHELVLEQGGVRIDLAAVERERLIVAEIKSEKDTLGRLADQVRVATSVAQEVWIVAAEKHLPAIDAMREPTISRELAQPRCVRLSGGGLATSYFATEFNPDHLPELARCHRFLEEDDGVVPDPTWMRRGFPYSPCETNPRAMLKALWADELRAVVGGGALSRQPAIDLGVETMTGRQIRRGMCAAIRARQFPRADAPVPWPAKRESDHG